MGTKKENNHAWKIITGILALVLGWHVAGVAFETHQRNQAIKQFNQVVEDLSQPDADPLGLHAHLRQERRRQATVEPKNKPDQALQPNERCFDGQRFRRLENGWQQLPNRPC